MSPPILCFTPDLLDLTSRLPEDDLPVHRVTESVPYLGLGCYYMRNTLNTCLVQEE